MLLDRLLSHLEVHVQHFAICSVDTGWRLCLPASPEVTVHFVLRGGGVIRCGAAVSQLSRGEIAIVPENAEHAVESGADIQHEMRITGSQDGALAPRLVAGQPGTASIVIACGTIEVRYCDALGLFDHLPGVLIVDVSPIERLEQIFKSIVEELSRPGPGTDALTSALMTEAMVHILRCLSEKGNCPLPWVMALEDSRLARALDLVVQDPGAHFTVDSLAETAGMSRSAFAELFVAAFGLPPMSLVHYIRMQRAAKLLNQGGQTIHEVAQRVGFKSRSHFSRAFKMHTGLLPSAFRQQA